MYIDLILYLGIYSFLGWVCECSYCSIGQNKIVNRGFMTGPFCPIYGFGAVLILTFLQFFPTSVLAIFIGGMILTSALEYFTSFAMEKIFNAKWWDYSGKRFNINGRVCLLNSTLFGFLCVILYFDIHPTVAKIIGSYENEFKMGFVTAFLIYFIVDFSVSMHTALGINAKFKRLDAIRQELERRHERLGVKLDLQEFKERLLSLGKDDVLVEEFIAKLKNNGFFERRLLSAFPQMENRKHPEYLKEIKNNMEKRVQKLKEKRNGKEDK